MSRALATVAASVVLAGLGADAHAAGLIPGAGESGHDPVLSAKSERYDRQFHTFSAAPFGLSLDAEVPDEAHRALVTDFLAQTAEPDFARFGAARGTPLSGRDVVAEYGEHGDLGMFAGFAAAGEAFRYMVLRDRRASAQEITRARADLLEAIASFHVAASITGTPGTVARGIRRRDEPGPLPETVAVPSSCPSPGSRGDTWRDDGSGMYPEWIYRDNNSKDQMLGYVFALGAFWDAVAADPDVPESVRMQLREDARLLGQSLMTPVQVRPGSAIDLVVRDWGDCVTEHHDLNPRLVPTGGVPIVLSETATNQNGWNALAALGIIRTLYHVSGDPALRTYYYDELAGRRDYPRLMITGPARVSAMYLNTCVAGNCFSTNFSNVNMAFTAIYGLLRYEPDAQLHAAARGVLEDELWNTSRPHDGIEIQQAWFNLVWAGFKNGASDTAAAGGAASQLLQFPDPPYWNPWVENCDAGELAAGTCVATDGTTIIRLDSVPSRGGGRVSETALPKSLRPPSNFEWRSDPRSPNGGGGNRLNPGGDFRGAYWLGRLLISSGDNRVNLSPWVRNRDGSGGPPAPGAPDAGVRSDAAAAADAAMTRDAAEPGPDAGLEPPADAGPALPDAGDGTGDGGGARDASQLAQDAQAGAGGGGEVRRPAAASDPTGSCACGTTAATSVRGHFPAALLLFALIAGSRRRDR